MEELRVAISESSHLELKMIRSNSNYLKRHKEMTPGLADNENMEREA